MTTERVADYRPDTPTACDLCGAPVEVTGEARGEVNVGGPADRAWVAEYGIEGDGPVTTVWNTYRCENGHDGPMLIA